MTQTSIIEINSSRLHCLIFFFLTEQSKGPSLQFSASRSRSFKFSSSDSLHSSSRSPLLLRFGKTQCRGRREGDTISDLLHFRFADRSIVGSIYQNLTS
ncbi:hypothetical protein PENTCL1PPCAC_13400, partial [Pristionchus entomophagus]